MPIYEFYCPRCHTLFTFLSRAVDTAKRPACPRCAREILERRVSTFAVSRGRAEPSDGLPGGLDEAGMERAMEALARQAEGMPEDDPRAMAGLMRQFYASAGLPLGGGMEEALRRMESGEDPDEIERELGDVLEQEDPLQSGGSRIGRLRRRLRPPDVDPELYEM